MLAALGTTAQGVSPGTRVVLRAGEHEAIAETRSLLPLGAVPDVTSLAAVYAVARLRGRPAAGVVVHQNRIYVQTAQETIMPWPLAARDGRAHVDVAVPV
ncbi:hypothetical protein [Streptomyces sp. NBC_01361]|uniref:hypothetical protein n=1 Tax=Streptomyces sp. NBC_01361 TaxID=2903838 RepID=UPI002E325D32|nr:hypothetical protein [Streptomyces sp. NBC_01361]